MNSFYVENNLSGLKREDFQGTIQGKETDLYILKNKNGCEIAVTNFAGALLSIMMPDREGKMASVVMGHDSLENVMNSIMFS
jgi:aldose 1-epimerase